MHDWCRTTTNYTLPYYVGGECTEHKPVPAMSRSPAEEYFRSPTPSSEVNAAHCGHVSLCCFSDYVLHRSEGFNDPGMFEWKLVAALAFAWFLIFVCLSMGVESIGKALSNDWQVDRVERKRSLAAGGVVHGDLSIRDSRYYVGARCDSRGIGPRSRLLPQAQLVPSL